MGVEFSNKVKDKLGKSLKLYPLAFQSRQYFRTYKITWRTINMG